MRLYFDACCVSRLTDNSSQERIHREAEAIEKLIGFATNDPNVWVGSSVLEAEIARNPDSDRRGDGQALLQFVEQIVKLDDIVISRARELQAAGFSEFDALHIACAERGKAEVLLTTDDRLVRRAKRKLGQLSVRVLNPVSFLEELDNAGARND